MWCPFGIPGDPRTGTSHLPLGLLMRHEGAGHLVALADLSRIEDVARLLGAEPLGELDLALIRSVLDQGLTPEQAHRCFPGVTARCWQRWYVTEPWKRLGSRRAPFLTPEGQPLLWACSIGWPVDALRLIPEEAAP